MAIHVPGTEEGDRSRRYPEDDGDNLNTREEEGDHSSRYPGEDSGNPNTRGQTKAIFDRKMLINIRIPDVTRGEDDCYVKESSWFRLTYTGPGRPLSTIPHTHTRTHTQRHRSPRLC